MVYVHPTLETLSLINNFTKDIATYTHADLFDDDSSDGSFDSDLDGMSVASLQRKRREAFELMDDEDQRLSSGNDGGIVKGGEVLSVLWDRVSRMGG